ncbi:MULTISPECIES: TIR domain-containing protein [unclassified Sulfitobacter]|uniref:TIR domain-containing protein n=1 Tax=unclassified Sulfitobacter TaxID=196795 RepID=UPI0037472D00
MPGAAYIVFDGDNDGWAYRYMNGWKANRNIDFTYHNAHDLDTMTGRAQNEQYVKSKLRERMRQSAAVVVLIGDKTKNLYKFVRWELELALDLELPIIAANLNKKNRQDDARCPAIIRDKGCVIHVPYTLKAIKFAMANWPGGFRKLSSAEINGGWRYYPEFD